MNGAEVIRARAVLRLRTGWVRWDGVRDCPDWTSGKIELDGYFTIDELRALITLRGLVR